MNFCDTRRRKGTRLLWKDFKRKTCIAIHRLQLGGQKNNAFSWTHLHSKTNRTRPRGENVQDTRITGSCLSTVRNPGLAQWTRGKTTHDKNQEFATTSRTTELHSSESSKSTKDHLRNDKQQNGSKGDETHGQVQLPGHHKHLVGFSKNGGGSMVLNCFLRVSLTGIGDSLVTVRVNSTLTSHACTRAIFFSCSWLKTLTRLKCFCWSIFCVRHLQKIHTARMPCSALYLIHHSRHFLRAHRIDLHCSLQIGLPLQLHCLADLPNNRFSQVMSPALRLQ